MSLTPILFRPPTAWACILILASMLGAGCSAPPPTRLEIAKAIRESDQFQQARWLEIRSRHVGSCTDAFLINRNWDTWKALGVIDTEETITTAGKVCQAILSEESRRESNNLSQGPTLSGESQRAESTLRVPIAVRNFVRTVEIRQVSSDTAEVDFEWQWHPNRIGEKLMNDNSLKKGWARLVNEERGWRTMSIRLTT